MAGLRAKAGSGGAGGSALYAAWDNKCIGECLCRTCKRAEPDLDRTEECP